jgi:fatty acid desaturase
LGFLGVLVCAGGLVFYSVDRWPWWATGLLVMVYGTCGNFSNNGIHELGHGTVFRTRWLNALFERVFSFLMWMNFFMFDTSHVRHHQFTLHPPDDLEVVLPIKLVRKDFFRQGFINWPTLKATLATNLRIACGQFRGEWELKLFPASDPAKRRVPIRWSRLVLGGHTLIFIGSVLAAIFVHPRWLMVTLLIDCVPFYCSWLFYLCNNTQHIGLQDYVPDFRLSCRTFVPHPVVQFLYWHMNYHIEHHMYAAVPCYKLARLHRLIQHDLPPCPQSLAATWKEIAAILKLQETDPAYQYAAPCPNPQPKDHDQRATTGPAAAQVGELVR